VHKYQTAIQELCNIAVEIKSMSLVVESIPYMHGPEVVGTWTFDAL